MTRPLVYDLTHLEFRSSIVALTGIDRVDFAYARHFASGEHRIAAATHYGVRQPKVLPPAALVKLVRRASVRWGEKAAFENDRNFLQCRTRILGPACEGSGPALPAPQGNPTRYAKSKRRLRIWSAALSWQTVPRDSLYLNVTQHSLEKAAYFEWLSARKDIRGVFFLHDLLPLDYPEYWQADHKELFSRRVDTIVRHASALITASRSVRERVLQELERRGKPPIPILSQPLPSALEGVDPMDYRDSELAAQPYFVVVGTIEPRKNHLLLLNIWRRLAATYPAPPKLIVIGSRGWENEQVVDMLERCAELQGLVWEATGLSNPALRRLIANARALLMPSFAEGFGLPIVEALSLGVPVVASDIPVFHEVTQGRAIFRDAIDGLGWLRAIEALLDPQSPLSVSAHQATRAFDAGSEADYFSAVYQFLAEL
jgi:glycosyltransferase involved in cell wall biosynthesis